MHLSRRRFIGAAVAATAGASAAHLLALPLPFQTGPAPSPQPPMAPAAPPARFPLLDEALAALDRHSSMVTFRDRIGLVDFAAPSREPRFHLVELASGRVERSWLVAHGSGSDPAATGMLERFSNVPGSNASSRGAYLSGEPYFGRHGRSQRLVGLDPENSNAYARAIVVHGADYVDPALVRSQGRIGRSQGCLAVEPHVIAAVMDLLGPGRLIYAGKSA